MYLEFFGLSEKPFAITPDPRYLFLSARHADALAHLVYGVSEAGGFIQLTGEVGTGKTTIIRSLLARAPKDAEIALILNPRLSSSEFLQTLCEELGLGSAETQTKELIDQLNRYLLRAHARGRRVVLIVDEAQNLSPEVLEQVRLLTNLETETQKLLQIILIGQPELRRLLAREDLRQLAQRITGRYHLDPLSREETAAYVRHRLRIAGATTPIFRRAALREIYRVSRGVPRLINVVCDRALLGAYSEDQNPVSPKLVRRAGSEVFGHRLAPRWLPAAVGAAALLLLAGTGAAMWRVLPGLHVPRLTALLPHHTPPAHPAAHPASAPPATAPRATPAASGAAQAPPASASAPAPAPAGASTASRPATLTQLLGRYRARTDAGTAFRTLLGVWNVSYSGSSAGGCARARTLGLLCLRQHGSLAQLRQLNRPAILTLTDQSGKARHVVLRALGTTSARLLFGTDSASVSIADLTHYWFGDFELLWRPGSTPVRELSAGMHGLRVRHLREQLERWQGRHPAARVSDRYDGKLVGLVEQFQRAHRLAVDGIAGIETQVALDAALAAPGSPVLRSLPGPYSASARGG